MKLYKVITLRGKLPIIFVEAENIEDCLVKAKKEYKLNSGLFSDEAYEEISSVELISKKLIK